jgi:DNA-binding SARP family transcriptional activator
LAQDDPHAAARCFAQAAQTYARRGWKLEHALLALYHAKALDRLGETEAARTQLRQALELRHSLAEPNCMLSEGRLLKALLQRQRSDTLAGRFLAQIEAFEKQLPSTRRELLRQPVVECAPVQPRLQIVALGKAQIEVDGRPICDGEWKKNSHRELFFYMLTQSSSLPRRELANLFFPHLEIERQNASLRNAIYHLSRLLGEEAIMREEERLAFNRQIDYVYDVERFLEGLAKARRVDEPREKLELYNETSEIYGGVYLPNITGSWVMPEREYLRQGYLEAMLQSGEIYLSLHEHGLALERVYRLLKQEPCLEPAHCLAMRIHAARGSRVDVIRQYQLCERSMAEQLNIQLASRTREIYLELTR